MGYKYMTIRKTGRSILKTRKTPNFNNISKNCLNTNNDDAGKTPESPKIKTKIFDECDLNRDISL